MTPISGSLIYITLGLSHHKPWKFASAIFAGELLYNEAIIWIGILIGKPAIERIISDAAGTIGFREYHHLVIISCASVVMSVYLLVRIDWNKIMESAFHGLLVMLFWIRTATI